MKIDYDPQEFYKAHLARDLRFDGKFFVAVKTTKIYCRPICPARKAQLKNIEFFIHATLAEMAGYRPCLRCKPEAAPGSTAWRGTSALVQRAIRLMDSTITDENPIAVIAQTLAISERWLRELFQTQVGISPQAILISKRLDLAKNLLDHSSLSITEIAFSAGFQSIRRFNDAFKNRFQENPRAFRKSAKQENIQQLQLSYRLPFSWENLLIFFRERALLGMELVEEHTYQRLVTYGEVRGWFKASLAKNNKVHIHFKFNKTVPILDFVARIKNLFDLDADLMAIEKDLKEDGKLTPFLAQFKGIRIPGCWDGFELAVRAIVGQKISVKAARTVLNRMVAQYGEQQNLDDTLPLSRFFPSPQTICAADLSIFGLTTSKIDSIKALARAVASKEIVLDGTADEAQTRQQLLAIKGIGPWTVEYIAMRALKNPDAFPETDLELQKKIKRFDLNPKKWLPWRAYAAILLFSLSLE